MSTAVLQFKACGYLFSYSFEGGADLDWCYCRPFPLCYNSGGRAVGGGSEVRRCLRYIAGSVLWWLFSSKCSAGCLASKKCQLPFPFLSGFVYYIPISIPTELPLRFVIRVCSGCILFGSVISVELLASEYGCDAGYHILELLLAPASRLGLLEFFVLTRVRRSGCSSFGWSLLRHGNLPLLHRVLLQLASHGAMETQLA